MNMKTKLLLIVVILCFNFTFSQNKHKDKAESYLKAKGEITFTFKIKNQSDLKSITSQLSIVNFDSKTQTVKAWANENQFKEFLRRNIPFKVDAIDNEIGPVQMSSSNSVLYRANNLTFPLTSYPTYADYAQQMANFAADNPSICELVDIGGTVEGAGGGNKRLLFIKLSDNVLTQEQEPRVMYTSSMHGDEIAGFPMMLDLIDYFITAYNDVGHSDHARVKNLIDNSEVWINPLANPDGTYYNSASNTSVANARRANANGVDLNRNYPDPSGVLHPDNQAYQTETLAFMNLAETKHFVVSANFHGGTEVVNYPWDYTYNRHPDDAWWIHVSSEYANNVQADGANNGFSNYFTDINNNGITHGADWYLVNGGRQDYMNFENQAKESTIELSLVKTPSASLLDNYWLSNKEALIDYLVQGTYGFRGVVKDAVSGNPIEATVKMVGHDDLGSWTTTELPYGDYYRPIKSGTYDIIFEAPCYQSFTLNNQIISDFQTVTLADVLLTPIGAVSPTGLVASNIGATTATLTWDASSGSTYDLRYREVGSSNWIVNAEPSASSSLSGLIAETQYEAQVRSKCTGGSNSPYSASINFTTIDVQLSYCNSASTNTNDEYISRVQLNTIDNSSGPQFYSDFTSQSTILTKDSQYTITVTPTWTGQVYNEAYSVWIDYNRDGDFNDSGEQVWSQGNTQATTVSGSFTIPTSATESSTRMRVTMRYNQVPGPCDSFTYGEVEDYTVVIESSAPDTTAPVIVLNGSSTIDLDVGSTYTELGATASDNIDGDITGSIVIGGDVVNTSSAGTYVVTYNVSDAAGNAATEVTRTVNVIPDTTAPVIVLNGSSTISLDLGGTYTEQGATATDNIDGDITGSIVIGGDVVNTSLAGAYVVTYNVSDAAGNAATQVTRTVNVIPDTTAPVIVLNGSSTISLDLGGTYTEQGATATDNIDGDITGSIVIGGDVVNTSSAGAYVVTYNVSDTAGNVATEVTRTVNVIPDTTAPVIVLNGSSTIDLDVGGTYTEQGATATDNIDGDITGSIVIGGDVINTSLAGAYVVTYNVSDAAGNAATEVTRTVNVIPDTTAPVIVLNGSSTIDLDVGSTYTELGATASDIIDGDITGSIIIGGDVVNTSLAGAYVVTYNVSDAAGNAATEATRTVNVIPDTTAPVIVLNGSSTINLDLGGTYTELGATASDNIDGDITSNIVVEGDVVNTSLAGTYVVTYNVSDAAGNAATEATRTVNVNEIVNGCTGGISSFPYSEGFENTLGAWSQSTNDDINWTVDANGTPSNNTGPASAIQGAYYVFVEASVNGTGYPDKRAILNSPCFDLSALSEATFSFKYHMYGASDMGSIDLEISNDQGNTWTSIWNQTGNKGNSWQTANVDLTAYVGGGVQLRFNRFVGSTWQADIAIDDVSLVEGEFVITQCSGGITTYPYTEGFENSIGAWSQSTADDINWTVDANGTPSNNTGPSSAIEGNNYIFVEASGNGTGYPSKQAIITSPCYDFTNETLIKFDFNYHMYGSTDMGTIALEVSNDDGNNWVSVWSESGNKGNSWQSYSVDLSSYSGESIQLRFNRITGGTWQADIAIDNINLTTSSGSARFQQVKDIDYNFSTIKLYPNPVKGNSLNVVTTYTNMSYEIYNTVGQIVAKGKVKNNTINIENLEGAFYQIKFTTKNKTIIKRFIKE
ncbi:putative secreted protein (Por secretion system target) [Ichthyenterobacterium magnum]|uniref:Putative secreted protein (Por secretion system target) n=2 Tax=Ichthyenterobacterium magnum TaxID=1230530 RepID=A0A420DXF7_9FLAO|nr:putative secreted protein (Por secretion system target) [Ichthyenterobacterium magnum]